MRPSLPRWPVLLLVAATLLGCGSSGARPASGSAGQGGVGAPGTGGQGGAAPGTQACLDRPTDLPRPPGSSLPCDLIPPGLQLH